MIEERHIPHRREMDLIGNVFKAHWGKITVILFTLGGVWATLQAQVSRHSDTLTTLSKRSDECHDFMIAQMKINEKIDKFDEKMDKIIERRVR